MPTLLNEALRNPHGGDRKSEAINVYNINVDHGGDRKSEAIKTSITQLDSPPPTGSQAQTLRRLRKDAPELYQRVMDKELSPNKTMYTLPTLLDEALQNPHGGDPQVRGDQPL